ncbi:MAG: ParM/StbA family protein [Rivularia sp. (in: cyanobacteria)]
MIQDITSNKIRPIVAVDAGNRFIKWITPTKQVRTLLSCIAELDKYDQYSLNANCPHTVYVELENGKKYLIGREAAQMGGQMVFDGDKCELAEILVLAALQPLPGESELVVEDLRLCLPDSRIDASREALQRLTGHRVFTRNSLRIHLQVDNVRAVDETVGSFRKAKNDDLFQYSGALNGVISLGGKDGIARLYTPDGNINRSADVKISGTLALITHINKALAVELGKTVKPSIIMDAIEKGDYLIHGTGFNFSKIFFNCRDKWWSEIRAAVGNQWQPFSDEIGEVLVVGGSAHLVIKKLPNDRYIVPTEPQSFDLRGLV